MSFSYSRYDVICFFFLAKALLLRYEYANGFFSEFDIFECPIIISMSKAYKVSGKYTESILGDMMYFIAISF